MLWTEDPVLVTWLGAISSVVLGLLVWLLGRFVIARLVRRVGRGDTIFRKPGLRWAQPVLRPLDSERKVQRAQTVGSLLSSLLSVVVVVIVAVYILISFRVDVGPLLASLGIVGVAVGFGCQQLIRDFLAGIFITIEDQYGIGDVIETSEVVGTVESVGLRITRVRAEDGAVWYLRNGEILRVGNRSQGDYHDPEAKPAEEHSDENAEERSASTEQRAGD